MLAAAAKFRGGKKGKERKGDKRGGRLMRLIKILVGFCFFVVREEEQEESCGQPATE